KQLVQLLGVFVALDARGPELLGTFEFFLKSGWQVVRILDFDGDFLLADQSDLADVLAVLVAGRQPIEIAPVNFLAIVGHVDEEHEEHRPQDDEPDPAAGHGRTGSAARLAGGRRCLTWGHVDSSTVSCGGLVPVRRGAILGGERSLKIANAGKPDYGDK